MQRSPNSWVWMGLVTACSVGAAIAVRGAMRHGWRAAFDEEPPTNPASSDTTWGSALLAAGAVGLVAGVARVVARRGAVAGWRRFTGRMPPGLE